MHLFDKEKDLILKITNLVLLVWLISAITFFHVALVNLIWPESPMEYVEYEFHYCGYKEPLEKSEEYDKNCKDMYELYRIHAKEEIINTKKSLLISVGNVVIVGVGLVLLNKKQ